MYICTHVYIGPRQITASSSCARDEERSAIVFTMSASKELDVKTGGGREGSLISEISIVFK